MENLLLYMMIAWYRDLRKLLPSATSRKMDADIRAFAEGNKLLTELLNKAKRAANAAKAKRRRNPIPGGFYRAKMKNKGETLVVRNPIAGAEHVPCGADKTGKPRQKDPDYRP